MPFDRWNFALVSHNEMADVDSEPEMPPDFNSLPSSSDSDEESDDGQCPPESSDNEDISREKKWVLLVSKETRRYRQHESNPIQEELWDG